MLDEGQVQDWIKQHKDELQQFEGEWVLISLKQEKVGAHGPDLSEAMREFDEKFKGESAYIHKVESEDEEEEYFTL